MMLCGHLVRIHALAFKGCLDFFFFYLGSGSKFVQMFFIFFIFFFAVVSRRDCLQNHSADNFLTFNIIEQIMLLIKQIKSHANFLP